MSLGALNCPGAWRGSIDVARPLQPTASITPILEITFHRHSVLQWVAIVIVAVIACTAFNARCQTPGDAAVQGLQFDRGAELYKRGAEQGDPVAALKLGLLITQGYVDDTKYGRALDWFNRACAGGDIAGCHNVAVAYEYGKNGAQRDYVQAQAFYLKAAERGYLQSQYNLGSLYSNGYLTPANDVEGLKWMLIAEKAAVQCKSTPVCKWVMDDPPKHRQRLRGRLSNAEQLNAESLATNWKPAQVTGLSRRKPLAGVAP